MPNPEKKQPVKVRFKAAKLVRDLGGPRALAETAALAGVSGVTYAAATKWQERDAMPLRAFAAICTAHDKLDETIPDPMDYIEEVRA